MSSLCVRTRVARLHLDAAGHVWCGHEDGVGENTGQEVAAFLAGPGGLELDRAECVRLLSTPLNSPLVLALQRRRSVNPVLQKKQIVQLASPRIVAGNDPAAVLHTLWQPAVWAALPGQWHEMTNDDYCTHALLQAARHSAGVTDLMRHTFRYHPAYAAFSFIPDVDLDMACLLVCVIGDPRWFMHPAHPHRVSRLHTYLGLTPATLAGVVAGKSQTPHGRRAIGTLSIWYNERSVANYRAGKCRRPEHFLWRIFAERADLHRGLLRATCKLVDFVRYAWLLPPGQTHPEAGFVFSSFFKRSDEAEAFARHKGALRNV